MADDETAERTLTMLRQAHLYSLPPRPSAGGHRCQNWPKSSHIFTGRVRVVSAGKQATVRIEDPSTGALFAVCPVSNELPETSVEPVADSSRYFVIRVADGERHAFLGLGFVERNDAFDFNVTLQDHVKHVRFEAQSARDAAAGVPAEPPQDFTLHSSVSIALPAANHGEAPKPREKSAAAAAPSTGGFLLPPPPPAGGGGGRRTAPGATPAADGPDAFGASSGDNDWATFG